MKRVWGLLLVFSLCACSTLATLSVGPTPHPGTCKGDDYVPRVYSGTFNDFRLFKRPNEGELLIVIMDLPFSFAFDTVVLPYTIPIQIVWGNICPLRESTSEKRSF